jgi:predicted membrane channel-forming protein YqfA (hemolysin III family)
MHRTIVRWLVFLAATLASAVAVDKGVIAAHRWKAPSHFPIWYVLGMLAALWLGVVIHGLTRRSRPADGRNWFTSVDQAYIFVMIFAVCVGELFDVIAKLASR